MERGCLDITARWEIGPLVSASKVLAAAYKSTSGKQVERNGFCRQGQRKNTQSLAGLRPACLEQKKTWNTPLAFKKKCGKLESCPSSSSQRAVNRQGFHLWAVHQCTVAGEMSCKCWKWGLILLKMVINSPPPAFSHRAGGRWKAMGLWWGEVGAQTRGSLRWGWSLPFVCLILFSIKIAWFRKAPPKEERIAACCVIF